jgi:hypothetical protein
MPLWLRYVRQKAGCIKSIFSFRQVVSLRLSTATARILSQIGTVEFVVDKVAQGFLPVLLFHVIPGFVVLILTASLNNQLRKQPFFTFSQLSLFKKMNVAL